MTQLLRAARHAIAYELLATAEDPELTIIPSRFTRLVELLLAEDFYGLEAFFYRDAWKLG